MKCVNAKPAMRGLCQCDDCRYFRAIYRVSSRLTPPNRLLVRDLIERCLHAEADRDYYRAKFKGLWPK